MKGTTATNHAPLSYHGINIILITIIGLVTVHSLHECDVGIIKSTSQVQPGAEMLLKVLLCLTAIGASGALDPEESLDTLGIILHWGYAGEAHTVQTDDGYILTMHRIPYGKGQQPGSRPVVFMQHGLECSSSNWVTNLPTESAGERS